MVEKNEITGDNLVSKPTNPAYENGWELIWGKKENGSSGMGNEEVSTDIPDRDSDVPAGS